MQLPTLENNSLFSSEPGKPQFQGYFMYQAGSAFPSIGTGKTLYAQVGYLFQKNLLADLGTIQPYAATQYSRFHLLKDPMLMYEGGINWLIEGHRSKLSLHYQSRPVFTSSETREYLSNSRKGMCVMQFQVSI